MDKKSFLQTSITLTQSIYPFSPLFNVAGYALINGSYKEELLIKSIQEVMRNCDILTGYSKDNNVVRMNFINKSDACLEWINNDAAISFEDKEPKLKIAIIKVSEKTNYWYVKAHHTLFDGYSMAFFFNQVAEQYSAYKKHQSFQVRINQYVDFIASEAAYINSPAYENDKKFWLNRIDAGESGKAFVSCFQKETKNSIRSKRKEIIIKRELFDRIDEFTMVYGSTPYHYFLSSLLILNDFYGNDPSCVGLPVFNRRTKAFKNTLGPMVNVLPFSVDFNRELSFIDFLIYVKGELKECYRHQQYPLGDLLKELDAAGNIFNLIFSYQKINYSPVLGNASASIVFVHNGEQQEDLVVHLLEYSEKGDLKLVFDYKVNVFSENVIDELMSNFENLLENNLLNPDLPLCKRNLLSDEEYRKIIYDFNNTGFDYPTNKNVIDLIEKIATKQSDKIAIRYKEEVFTYQELIESSNSLAAYFIRHLKVAPGAVIGIKLERGFWLVAGLIGILKSGSAYLPLDLNYPAERNDYLLKDSGCKYVFDETELWKFKKLRSQVEPKFKKAKIHSADLAYLIYTSGSTGHPKSVMIDHGNLNSFIHWCINEFKNSSFDITYWVTSICFDLSVFEIFYSLCSGKEIRVLSNALSIAEYIKYDQNILINTLPSVVKMLVENKVPFDNVSVLNMAGEPIPKELIQHLDTKRIEVRNLYGPSEDTTYSTVYKFNGEKEILIGKPISNTQAYILNKNLKPVPKGVKGELFLSGHGLSTGYLNRVELTKEKFKHNPFIEGENMYSTGDMCVWTPKGYIEFVGRIDNQLKVRGYRVEPGEIENYVQSHEAVDLAVVIPRELEHNENALVVFIKQKEGKETDLDQIKSYVEKGLPAYLMPDYFVEINEVPLTPNGKIDRTKLLQSDISKFDNAGCIQPKNEMEEALFGIWKKLLKVDNFGTAHDFFRVGGHSLRAARLSSAIQEHFGKLITVNELFHYPTISAQANLLREKKDALPEQIKPLVAAASYAVSQQQQGMWILCQDKEANLAYTMTTIYSLKGNLNVSAFRKAFKAIVNRHESLRTIFRKNESGEIIQVIIPDEQFGFDISHETLSTKFLARGVNEQVLKEMNEPLHLENGPLFKIILYQARNNEWLFLFKVHHIVCDGWSLQLLLNEFVQLYDAQEKVEPFQLQPLTIQYKEYTQWSTDLIESRKSNSLSFWKKELTSGILPLELPLDYPRFSVKSFKGQRRRGLLNKKITGEFLNLCRNQEVTPFIGIFSVLGILMNKYTSQDDFIIGTSVAGRNHQLLENQIGYYVNTIPVRCELEQDSNFSALLKKFKQKILLAMEHQYISYADLLKSLNVRTDRSRNPLFDIFITFQSNEYDGFKKGFKFGKMDAVPLNGYEPGTSKFDLLFDFELIGDEICYDLEFNTELFKVETIERLSERLLNLLQNLVTEPNRPIKNITCLSEKEEFNLLNGFHGEKCSRPKKTVIDLFQEQVKLNPDRIALTFENRKFSFNELNVLSNQLANYLCSFKKVKREDFVGILLDRDERLIISILAVFKALAAYVPMDISYPEERNAYIIKDSNCRVRIDETVWSHFLEKKDDYNALEFPGSPTLASVSHIIYTSGSTGIPKGVVIEHQSTSELIFWAKDEFKKSEVDAIFCVTSICFDLSVFEIFYPLCFGKKLMLLKNALSIPEALPKERNVLLNTVPSVVETLLKNGIDLGNVTVLNMAGEALPSSLVKGLDLKKMEVRNLYGPSEDTTYSTAYKIESPDSILIGKPIPNTQLYILDRHYQLVPVGIAGELFIGGQGLAKGYLNLVDLTQQKFISNPFNPKEKIYRTGDLARWMSDGNIEFIGRKDNQVKIRGYRIELGEIETHLKSLDMIENAVVIPVGPDLDNKVLTAYLETESELDNANLKSFLATKLPYYMIPGRFIKVPQILYTPNGKVDRTALATNYSSTMSEITYTPPSNKIEVELVEIFTSILGIEKIGVTDNFFALGGNSLMAMKLSSEIARRLKIEMDFSILLKNPTIKNVAQEIEKDHWIQPSLENVDISDYEEIKLE